MPNNEMIDFLIYTPFALIALSYLMYFLVGRKASEKPKWVRRIEQINYLFLVIGLLLVLINLLGYSLSSIWTTKAIAWVYLITACFQLIYSRQSTSQFEKVYTSILLYSPLSLIVSWLIPMLGIWICYTFSLFFYVDESTIVFNDKNYMLKFEEGFLVYDYDPTLYYKYGFLQKKIKDLELKNWNFENNVELKSTLNNNLQIKYFDNNQNEVDTIIKLYK